MRSIPSLFIITFLCGPYCSCKSQPSFGSEYLPLIKTIRLPGVKGRIDHLEINLKDKIVYIAALGNNTLEAINLSTGEVIHSIKGFNEPQGVGYIPQHNEIIVANGGTGDCYFYDANTFEKRETIKLSSDADDVRYDSAERKIYIGYGSGGIAVIDADSHKQIGDIKLPVHPEGFQIDKELNRLYVNLPDANSIGVAELIAGKLVAQWKNKNLSANFPMAINPVSHQMFAGYRKPPTIVVINGKNSQLLSSSNITGDTDDLYYEAETGRIYISGGSGTINIFQLNDTNGLKQIANITTVRGARTSLLIASLHLFVVAAPAISDKAAELLVYETKK
jgi:DNA-binding beta-propeller fold protein YncE